MKGVSPFLDVPGEKYAFVHGDILYEDALQNDGSFKHGQQVWRCCSCWKIHETFESLQGCDTKSTCPLTYGYSHAFCKWCEFIDGESMEDMQEHLNGYCGMRKVKQDHDDIYTQPPIDDIHTQPPLDDLLT